MKHKPCHLNLAQAITLEAKQNRERDRRVLGQDADISLYIYREEAKHLLITTGQGYYPDFNDHKLVKLKK